MDRGYALSTPSSTYHLKTKACSEHTGTADHIQTPVDNWQQPAISKNCQRDHQQECKSEDRQLQNDCHHALTQENQYELSCDQQQVHKDSKYLHKNIRYTKNVELNHNNQQSETDAVQQMFKTTGESLDTPNHQLTCGNNVNYQSTVTSVNLNGIKSVKNIHDNCQYSKNDHLSTQQKYCQLSKCLDFQNTQILTRSQQSKLDDSSAEINNQTACDVNGYNRCTEIEASLKNNSDEQLSIKNIQRTVTDSRYRQSDNANHNYERFNSSFDYYDRGRQTSCSFDEVFTTSSQDDIGSCYSESICTSQDDTESNYDGSISSTQDDFAMPTTFQVKNCSQVQIGSTINFYGPVSVTENCEQKLPLQSMFSNAQVNLFDGSVSEVGSRVNYNGPVNITKIVNVNGIQYEDFERLAIDDTPHIPDKTSDPDPWPKTPMRLIGRRMWLAQPPLEPPEKLQHPVPYVVILHSATEECLTQSDCVFITRQIQNFHVEGNGWSDIGYSFLIGGDGNVYEGRGWDKLGAFAKGFNHLSIGIALIGTFTNVLPSDLQLRTLDYWIEEGVRLGKISPDYKILTHQQLSRTTSPGTAFVKLIKTWPRWSDTPQRE